MMSDYKRELDSMASYAMSAVDIAMRKHHMSMRDAILWSVENTLRMNGWPILDGTERALVRAMMKRIEATA